ncbi:RfaL Lipid A core - O-antigen ligase and related enzymes [Candidatus Nanopelagicaceae bacterium]
MITMVERNTLERLLTWTAVLTTLIVLPWSSFDPINVPKLAVIAVGGFMASGLLVSNSEILKAAKFRPLMLVTGLFIVDLLVVLFFSGNNFYQGLFGTFGRASGFVAYVSLTFLLIAAAIASSSSLAKKLCLSLMAAGLASSIYGLFQSFNLDVFKWVNQYSPVIGFLGNPNFQSSFVGFSGIAAFGFILAIEVKKSQRYASLLYLMLAAYVIKETDSQQGFLVLFGGIAIVMLIWISKSKYKYLKYPSLILGFIGVALVTLGSINKGPLASLLYKLSVTYRGDYWHAGWKMTTEHPLLGVGLDSYGDWYRRTRTVAATLRRGPDVTSNAAHNVLLDLSSNGGFPLLVIYLAIVFMVIRAIVKILKRATIFDPAISGLIAVWFAYLAQSIISLNQLGLAVWGWIISGLIIGYEINSRDKETEKIAPAPNRKGRNAKEIASSKVSPKTYMAMISGLVVGALLGLPPLMASSKYLTALKSGDVKKVEQAAYIWPVDPYRMGQVAISLANNKFQDEALVILKDGTEKFPDEYQMWRLLSEIPNATPEQVAEAKRQMKRLDPHNPDLK